MSFHHAPVTKGLMICVGACSLLGSVFDVRHFMPLQLVPHVLRHHQYWRVLTYNLGFANSSELFLAELLLFRLGVPVERLFGSRRYGSFVLVSTAVGTLLSVSSLLLFSRLGLRYIPAGPFALIFSIVYQHSRVVPPTYTFDIFGLELNTNSFMYFLAVQLAISQLPGSAAAALVGLLTGQLARTDFFGLKSYRVSQRVAALCARFLLPLIGSTRPPRRSARAGPATDGWPPAEVVTTAGTDATAPARGAGASVVSQWMNELSATRPVAVRGPTEAEITQVASVFPGMPRAQIVTALQQSPNTERAVEVLLERSAMT